MHDRVNQCLRIQPGEYVIEYFPEAAVAPPTADWLALVRAPEGLTIVRPAKPEDPVRDRWVAFYSGQTAHGLDVPGMLAAVVNPLAQAALSVFVASTYHADLVLVQAEHAQAAIGVLRGAGHAVEDAADASA
jgi:uncharacterized protein